MNIRKLALLLLAVFTGPFFLANSRKHGLQPAVEVSEGRTEGSLTGLATRRTAATMCTWC